MLPAVGSMRLNALDHEVAFGPEHPNVARDVNNLGSVLQVMGDHAGARAAFERALRIWKAALVPEHPSTCAARQNLNSLPTGKKWWQFWKRINGP